MAREKGNRHVTAFGSEALLEFETIPVRRRYIKDETARNGGSRTGEGIRVRMRTSPAANQRCYTRFFSYGLIATVIPSEGNLATDSSSEGSSQ